MLQKLARQQVEMSQRLEKERLEKEELAKRLAAFDARAKAEREEHARLSKPSADEVITYMSDVAKNTGIVPMSEDCKQLVGDMMTDASPIGREVQAVQIACARNGKKLALELEELRTKYNKLEEAARVATDMAGVADDAERSERRDLKAGRRAAGAGASIMQDDNTTEDATGSRPLSSRPSWAQRFHTMNYGNEYGYAAAPAASAPVPQVRQLNAGRNTGSASATEQSPLLQGAPSANNMASRNQEFWKHMVENYHDVSLDGGAMYQMAGRHFRPSGPQAGSM
jgi:hypothetical protein